MIAAVRGEVLVRRPDHVVVEADGAVGGGAAPLSELPGFAVALGCEGLSASSLEARLRLAEPPVIVRVEDGRVLLDLRMVAEDEEDLVVAALTEALAG